MSYPRTAGGRQPNEVAPSDSYARWIRSAMKRTANWPEAAALFDSTMREPTELLMDVVRSAFDGGVTDRYQSVFAAGNRFVVDHVARRHGVAPEQVISATGATSALAMALKALVAPGDEVLVEQPCFDLLPQLAREAGAVVKALPRSPPAYDVDVAEAARLIGPRTRAIILTQLHNPTGAVLSTETLRALGAAARQAGVLVIVDEVYADFIDGGAPAAQLGHEFLSVGSLTKVQGLFALKCGWAVGAPDTIARINDANPQGDLGVSKLAHAMAALVMERREAFDEHWRNVLGAGRPVVAEHVEAMVRAGLIDGALPRYGCMYFPRVVGVDDTRALADWLWREHGLVAAAGEFFGQAGHMRIGFGGGRVAELDQGLSRFRTALEAYPARS